MTSLFTKSNRWALFLWLGLMPLASCLAQMPSKTQPSGAQTIKSEPIITKTWLQVLQDSLGTVAVDKVRTWFAAGLDSARTAATFMANPSQSETYNALDKAQSLYHQRIIIRDWTHIPGLTKMSYGQMNMPLPEKEIPAALFGEADARYNLATFRAATFTGCAVLVQLIAGTKLYRVTAERGRDGGFWTLTPPQGLTDVIGGTAVMPEWNNFSKVYEYTVPEGGLKVWVGRAAAQQISQVKNLQSTEYSLLGGDIQVFINEFLRDRNTTTFGTHIIDVTEKYKKW